MVLGLPLGMVMYLDMGCQVLQQHLGLMLRPSRKDQEHPRNKEQEPW